MQRNIMKTNMLSAMAVLAAAALCTPVQAAVTRAVLNPDMRLHAGDCPARVVFRGSITANAPGVVRYVFTRSDGAVDTDIKTLRFARAGTLPVTTTWTLGGAPLPQYKGWEAIKVLQTRPVLSNEAAFEVRCDPPLNSAKAAHGNTDWHIDTANEFLFGKDMGGHDTAANHAPDSWTKTHIHVGLTNTSKYYDDKSHLATADDANLSNGIDKPMLFFYAGHGNPTTWNTLGDNGHQTDVLLANLEGGGQLRYFWQCSCEVFAHGPRVCSGGDCDHSQPENFDGSADSATMRNVFERWGPAIGKDLRMACGVSTLAYCHEGNVNAIWNKFNNEGASVAESFILGLGSASVKPLCITRGGADITRTPLYDTTFTNRRNTSGSSHLHILYSGGTQTEPAPIVWVAELIPLKLKRVRVTPEIEAEDFRRLIAVENGVERLRSWALSGGSAIVTRHAESGAVSLKAALAPPVRLVETARPAPVQRTAALSFMGKLGWLGDDIGPVEVNTLMTASMPGEGQDRAIKRAAGNVVVTAARRVRNGNHLIDVIGVGGRTTVTLSPAGQVLSAARTWRKAETTSEDIDIKPFKKAQAEALSRIKEPDTYKLAEWRFGYKEAAPNEAQGELTPVYQFDYVPRDRARLIDFPPQRIEVLAEDGR
jgi:hypothetical protein